jgi:hypothetical protein
MAENPFSKDSQVESRTAGTLRRLRPASILWPARWPWTPPIQTEHLHEQREVILANLKLKRWGERITIAIQIFFALGFSTSAAGDGL